MEHSKAVKKVRELLHKEIAHNPHAQSVDHFDPWEIFPSVYGVYSYDFDECMIGVLRMLISKNSTVLSLAENIFLEMLCTAGLCDYGSSPRTCFPTTEFIAVLPMLLEKWEQYALMRWSQ